MSIEAEAWAGLCASVDSLTTEMREERRRKAELAASCWYVPAPVIPFGSLPAHGGPVNYGPNTGFCWAIQRISVVGFGATTDFVNIFRGHSLADAVGQNYLNTLQESVAGGGATWHPGSKSLILMPEETLVLSGTFTGAQGYLSSDVIQVEIGKLAYFLL